MADEQEELAKLRREVTRLRRYKAVVEGELRGAKVLGKLAALVWIGPNLATAFSAWLSARKTKPNEFPIPETADLAAAVTKRVLRVGIFAALLALVPTALIFAQVWLMRGQNGLLREQNKLVLAQNEYLRDQISEMRDQGEVFENTQEQSRRAELIVALYCLIPPSSPIPIPAEVPGGSGEMHIMSDSHLASGTGGERDGTRWQAVSHRSAV